jgi:hypothetical protein
MYPATFPKSFLKVHLVFYWRKVGLLRKVSTHQSERCLLIEWREWRSATEAQHLFDAKQKLQ